jgi:2-oxoglutarate ferredoxin oxidoreductase subunit alpha
MKTLLMKELAIPQQKLISVLNYNGIPITADAIKREVSSHLALNNA